VRLDVDTPCGEASDIRRGRARGVVADKCERRAPALELVEKFARAGEQAARIDEDAVKVE
jgi:hypothetical protein